MDVDLRRDRYSDLRILCVRRFERHAGAQRLDGRGTHGRAGRGGEDPHREPRRGAGVPAPGGRGALPCRHHGARLPPSARDGGAADLHHRLGRCVPRGPARCRGGLGVRRARGLREPRQRMDEPAGQSAAVGAHHRRVVPAHALDVARRCRRRGRGHHERGQGPRTGVRQGAVEARDVQGRGGP